VFCPAPRCTSGEHLLEVLLLEVLLPLLLAVSIYV
jgi:hypothetical protein